ncbi:hypothetical protein Tco_1027040 [Tanacetum coccineum]
MNVSFPSLTDTNHKDYLTVIYAEIGWHESSYSWLTHGVGMFALGNLLALKADTPIGGLRKANLSINNMVPSTTHGMMKFPTRVEVATIMSERARPLEKPDVASASRSSPKNRKCQGCNTPGIPKAIRHY